MVEVVREFTVSAHKIFETSTLVTRELLATILNKGDQDVMGVASYTLLEPPMDYIRSLSMDTIKTVSFRKQSATTFNNYVGYLLRPRKDIKHRHTLRIALNLQADGQSLGVVYKAIVNTIGLSTDEVTNDPKQQKIHYINDRYWFFFSDGMDLLYTVSSDGITWSKPKVIGTPENISKGFIFDTFFDGTYLHITFWGNWYRRFIPVDDILERDPPGDPEWFEIESGVSIQTTSITVDTDGYPWIANDDPGDSRIQVTKSATNDGTWVTDTDKGFPYAYYTFGDPRVTVRRLSSGKVLLHWIDEQTDINVLNLYVQVWDGTSWLPTATYTRDTRTTPPYNVITRGDDAYILYDRELYKYSFETNDITPIGTAIPLFSESAESNDLGMMTYDQIGDKLYITWLISNRSVLRRRVYNIASNTLEPIYTVANISPRPNIRCRPTASHSLINGKIGVAYTYTDEEEVVYEKILITEP